MKVSLTLTKERLAVYYPDEAFPAIYAEMESKLQRNGTPISTMDILIACSAIARSMPLVTRNVRDFEKIDALAVEPY